MKNRSKIGYWPDNSSMSISRRLELQRFRQPTTSGPLPWPLLLLHRVHRLAVAETLPAKPWPVLKPSSLSLRYSIQETNNALLVLKLVSNRFKKNWTMFFIAQYGESGDDLITNLTLMFFIAQYWDIWDRLMTNQSLILRAKKPHLLLHKELGLFVSFCKLKNRFLQGTETEWTHFKRKVTPGYYMYRPAQICKQKYHIEYCW